MRTMAFFSLSAAPFVTGCQGTVWGNIAMLILTVGIFMGTIKLGRGR